MLLFLSLAALALFVAAATTDAIERRIPNVLSIGLAVVGLCRIALALADGGPPVAALADVAAATAIFAAGAVAFGGGYLGGGDVKLLAAGTLWAGAAGLLPFLTVTALAGGILAAAFLAVASLRADRRRIALPYGIAIAAGGVLGTGGAALGLIVVEAPADDVGSARSPRRCNRRRRIGAAVRRTMRRWSARVGLVERVARGADGADRVACRRAG